MIHLSIGESGAVVNYFRSKNTMALLIFNTPPTISHFYALLISKHALTLAN